MASPELEEPGDWVAVPSVDDGVAAKLLPLVLSVTAGSVDVIGFLGLGGLFTAHITGNLVLLAAHVVTGGSARPAAMLSVPVFMAGLALARLLAGGLAVRGIGSLSPLLLLQFLLLAGFLVLCAAEGPSLDPDAPIAVLAGMLGVLAMAVQNALVQISLKGAPSTAVMTTNITRFTMDAGEALLARDPASRGRAWRRAQHTWPAILGFAVGCALGAACEVPMGLDSLVLPTGLALLALAMGFVASRNASRQVLLRPARGEKDLG